jgi:hypothetical protein
MNWIFQPFCDEENDAESPLDRQWHERGIGALRLKWFNEQILTYMLDQWQCDCCLTISDEGRKC